MGILVSVDRLSSGMLAGSSLRNLGGLGPWVRCASTTATIGSCRPDQNAGMNWHWGQKIFDPQV